MTTSFIPAILEHYESDVDAMLRRLVSLADRIQIDYADDTLVKNRLALPEAFSDLSSELELDAHLMVDQPTQYFDYLQEHGFKRIIFHYEAAEEPEAIFEAAQLYNFGVGMAVNPDTPIADVLPFVPHIEFLQIMGIEPGFGGQELLDSTYLRVREARQRYDNLIIAVDGGVRTHNALMLKAAGADMFVVGKGGWLTPMLQQALREWQDLLV